MLLAGLCLPVCSVSRQVVDRTGQDTYLLVEGLREDDRVGTGKERPLESTSASLFERGTVFTTKKGATWTTVGVDNLKNVTHRFKWKTYTTCQNQVKTEEMMHPVYY